MVAILELRHKASDGLLAISPLSLCLRCNSSYAAATKCNMHSSLARKTTNVPTISSAKLAFHTSFSLASSLSCRTVFRTPLSRCRKLPMTVSIF